MEWLAIGAVALFAIIFGFSALKIVRPFEKGVVERLGKYHRTIVSGIQLVWPWFERLRKVDLRERVMEVPPQEVITKDNVVVTVDAVIYSQVTDPVRVLYNVEHFQIATQKLAQTNLRNVVGDLELDATLTSRDRINAQLREVLDEATDKWGVRITRVEIQKIDPPRDIIEAMGKQMKAERERRAAILQAEGVKQSAILQAEGDRQSRILEAEGRAEATKRVADAEKYRNIAVAEGEAQAIETVYRAIHEGRPTNDLIAIKYLEALQKIADGKATKVFLPMETSGVLGSIAALGEMFKESQATAETVESSAAASKPRLAEEQPQRAKVSVTAS